jgi:nitric oxide reductase NorD protein
MAEPEDLILDGAYIASRLARDAWRRYAPAAPERVVRLVDVRVRLELFLNALFERPLAVAAAEPPPPVSWLARAAGRAAEARAGVMAGTDGVRIYLPPMLDASRGIEDTYQTYLLLAAEQSVRLSRGSATAVSGMADKELRDRFLMADAVAVDDWIVREAPGLVPSLRAARREALARRTVAWPRRPRECAIEVQVRGILTQDPSTPFGIVPVCRTVEEALAWASANRPVAQPAGAYRGIAAVWYWGRSYAPVHLFAAERYGEDAAHERPGRRRVAEMRRRPRMREATGDEDDSGRGAWMIRPDEPQESVEDPFGLQRPTDRADEPDADALGDSLAELPEARVVRTPGPAKEVLRAGEELARAPRDAASPHTACGIAYPEWDYRSGTYRRPGAIVRETTSALGDAAWVNAAMTRHRQLVGRVRTRFERLRPRRLRIGRQSDGPELDIAEYIRAAADSRAGGVVEDRLYVEVRPGRRELTVALLVDVSASTDSWVSGHQRIVDVEKDALLVVCEALATLGDPHVIFAFSGEGAEHVSIVPLKRFTDRPGDLVRRRVAALDANGYTRVGAAIRHATAALSARPTRRRLLLVLSDGKPNDVDAYDGPYGIEDARQAIAEARLQNVDVFCLTVDREAPRYAPRIFGRTGFTVLRRPDQLPAVLVDVLRRLIRPRG